MCPHAAMIRSVPDSALIPARHAPPHWKCWILCLFPQTLNQFRQLLNYFNFSSFSKSLKYILYIGYRLKKESYRCALASEILPEKCMYFISAFHFSRHFFCFEEAWNSNRLMATLQLYWLTVSGQALQCLRIHPEMGAGELLHFPAERRKRGVG